MSCNSVAVAQSVSGCHGCNIPERIDTLNLRILTLDPLTVNYIAGPMFLEDEQQT